MKNPNSTLRITAAAARDATGLNFRPACILWNHDRIEWIGPPDQAPESPDARRIDRPRHLLLPPFANAHTHLDLTAIGPQPFDGSFTYWINMVRTHRATTQEAIGASTTHGITLAHRGGTALIGDIAGSAADAAALHALRTDGRLHGVSFVEFFAASHNIATAKDAMTRLVTEHTTSRSDSSIKLGLQPHAPYSADRALYEHAVKLANSHRIPLSTHLAETRDEIEFADCATGPIADFLRSLSIPVDPTNAMRAHPLEHLIDPLTRAPWILAHMNYPPTDDALLQRLVAANASIVFCPRAHAYFQHENHPWQRYLDIGINVALGTDSIIGLDTPQRISILDEMRLLHQRDSIDPNLLLTLATSNGARALASEPALLSLQPGPSLGVIALPINPADRRDPLQQVLTAHPDANALADEIEWIASPAAP